MAAAYVGGVSWKSALNKSGRDKNNRAVFRARNYRSCVSTAVCTAAGSIYMRVEFRGHASIHEEIMRGCGNERPPSIFNLSTDDRKRPQRARHIVTPKRTRFEPFSLSLSFPSFSKISPRLNRIASCYDLFAIFSLCSAPESRTSFSSSFLKKRKIIFNEKLVVVEREYRGLESVETEYIYIYAYVRRKVHLRLAIEKREKSEEYGRENGPDRKEMNCQHCLVI